jgi:hypothetical protein
MAFLGSTEPIHVYSNAPANRPKSTEVGALPEPYSRRVSQEKVQVISVASRIILDLTQTNNLTLYMGVLVQRLMPVL